MVVLVNRRIVAKQHEFVCMPPVGERRFSPTAQFLPHRANQPFVRSHEL